MKIDLSDPRFIYIGICVIVLYGVLNPIMVPIPISQFVRDYWEWIQIVEPGDNVYYCSAMQAVTEMDLLPQHVMTLKYLSNQDADIMIWDWGVAAGPFTRKVLALVWGEDWANHPDYGEKFVYLGYVPGGISALQTHVYDIRSLSPVDHKGVSLDLFSAMDDFNSHEDIKLIVGIGVGPDVTIPAAFVTTFDIPYIYCDITEGVSLNVMLYRAGLMKGVIYGMRGAAEFEFLSDTHVPESPPMAYIFALIVSMTFVIIGLIISNIYFVLLPKLRGKT